MEVKVVGLIGVGRTSNIHSSRPVNSKCAPHDDSSCRGFDFALVSHVKFPVTKGVYCY